MKLVSNLDYCPSESEHILKTYTDLYVDVNYNPNSGSLPSSYNDIPAIGTGSSYRYPKAMFVGGSTIVQNTLFGHNCINATQVWPPIVNMNLIDMSYDTTNNLIYIDIESPYTLTEVAYARQGAFKIKYAYTSGTKPNCTYQMSSAYITSSFPSSNTSHTVWTKGSRIFIKNEPNCKYKILPVENYGCLNKADLYPGYFTHLEFLAPDVYKARTTPTISGYVFDHNTSTHISRRQYSFDENININANIGTGTAYYGKKWNFFYKGSIMHYTGPHGIFLIPTYDEKSGKLFDKHYLLGSNWSGTSIDLYREEYNSETNTYINTYHGPIVVCASLMAVSTMQAAITLDNLFITVNQNRFGSSTNHQHGDTELGNFYVNVENYITGDKYTRVSGDANKLLSAFRGNHKQCNIFKGSLRNVNTYAYIDVEKYPSPQHRPGQIRIANSSLAGFPTYIYAYTASDMNFITSVTQVNTNGSISHTLGNTAGMGIVRTATKYDAESLSLGTYVYFYPFITMLITYYNFNTNSACSYLYATYTTSEPICAVVSQFTYNNGTPGNVQVIET